MPHQTPGTGLRVTTGQPAHRHAAGSLVSRQTTRALIAGAAVLVLVNVGLLAFRSRRSGDDSVTTMAPMPAISFPAPSTVQPSRSAPLFLERSVRQATKPRPSTPAPTTSSPTARTAVLLGPDNLAAWLTTYCQQTSRAPTVAILAANGWQCAGYFSPPQAIDMDAACRSLYGQHTYADMIDDNDPQSWRCYTDGT